MRGLTARLGANLAWIIVFSVVVVIGALVTYAGGAVFADTYTVAVPMSETGGLVPNQEVTVLGDAVGRITDTTVTQDGVVVELSIDGDQRIPANSPVTVVRRSPIGEQVLDFRPQTEGWEAADPGERITPAEVNVPPEIPSLLREASELLGAIEQPDLETIITEAADAFGGRGDTLRQLTLDSLELQRTLVDGIPAFERLVNASTPILESLRSHRQALAEGFTNARRLAEVFAEQRPALSSLLDEATPALNAGDELIRSQRANLSCLNEDLLALNELMLGPSTAVGQPRRFYETKLDELDAGLKLNRRFFQEGFYVIQQPDPATGVSWTRIQFNELEETGERYQSLRDTPATTPGAACRTEAFGTGVNAVRQPDHVAVHRTSPGIDFAPLVEPSGGSGPRPAASPDTGPAADDPPASAPIPATGGGLAGAALAMMGTAVWLRRRES